jgi:competence protein ComEC
VNRVSLESAPLLPLGVGFAVGIVVASWQTVAPAALLALAGALLLGAALSLRLDRDRLTLVLLLPSIAALGALRSATVLPPDHLALQALPTTVTLEGRLAEEPVRFTTDRARLLLDTDAYQQGADRRPVTGRVQLTIYGEAGEPLGEGQRIRLEVRLHRPIGFRNPGAFDYPAHLRREGILLVGSGRADRVTALTTDAPPWPVRIRRWAVARLRAELPEASAALLAGLLLGERTALPGEIDEAFRRAGVYHILAVSGFNVALLASSVFGSLALLGVPRRPTALAAVVVLIGFALVVGGQASVLRATVMGLLLLGGVLMERESQVMNALGLAGLALLVWSPTGVWDPGFQLSFAATAGIVYLTAPFTEGLQALGWPRWLATAVAVSAGAQLPVTPIMLAHFNQLSLIGVAANLLVVPLAGPATTLGMLALAVDLLSETVAGLLFNALWLLLLALRVVVWAAAAVPAAMVHLPAPSWAAVVAWAGALVLVPHLAARVWARRVALGLLVTALALSVWPWLARDGGRLRITFLDVGQGDAIFAELPEGRCMLVDGGPGGSRRFDVGERVLSPFLWNRPATRLDVVALSHADSDHSGGLGAVLRHFTVGEFWENGRGGPAGEETRLALLQSGAPRRVLRAGERYWLGGALLSVLNPDERTMPSLNDDSLVLRLDWRGVSVLLTGDLGWPGEARVLEHRTPVRALVLKVGHHGSRFSSSPSFLETVRPAFAIISVGARNPFRHPTRETLGRLEAAGARIYRTDRDGAIVVESDGEKLWITRWATRATEVFDLDNDQPGQGRASAPPPRSPENTTAPGSPGGRDGTRGEREGSSAPEGALVVRAQPLQLLGIETHTEGEPHLSQDRLDLVQRFLAEVLGLEQLRLGPLDQVGDGPDIRGLQAVGSADGQLQLVHAPEQMLVDLDAHRGLGPRFANLRLGRRGVHEIGEQVELVLEDPGRLGHRRLGRHAAVGPQLEEQALLRVRRRRERLDAKVGPLHGREVRVHQHGVDRQRLRLSLLRRLVSAAPFHADFHLEHAVLVEGGEDHVGHQDVDVSVGLKVLRRHRPRALGLEPQELGPIHAQDEHELAEVHEDIERVLGHSRHVRELVKHTLDLDPGGRSAGDGREQDAAVGIADREAEARLEGLHGNQAIPGLTGEPLVTHRER